MIAFFYFTITLVITLNILNEDLSLLAVLFAMTVFLIGSYLSLKAFDGFWQDDGEQEFTKDTQGVRKTAKPFNDSLSEKSNIESSVGPRYSKGSDQSPLRFLIKIISLAEIPLFLYFWVTAVVAGGLWGAISGIISGVILTFVSLLSVYFGLVFGVLAVLLTEISVTELLLYMRAWWMFINSLNHWFANIWNEDSPTIEEIWIDSF